MTDSADHQTKHGSWKRPSQEVYLTAFQRRKEDERDGESNQKANSTMICSSVWSGGIQK